jgi:hypothetical protein
LQNILEASGGGSQQTSRSKRGNVMKETQEMHLQRFNRQTTELRKVKTSQAKETTTTEDIFRPKGTSQK